LGEEIAWMQPIKRKGEIWWDSSNGSCMPEECYTNLKILQTVDVEDESELDWTQTTAWKLLKEDAADTSIKTGWLGRSGEFHRCRWHRHVSYARRVLGMTEREMTDTGWIKITAVSDRKEPFWVMRDLTRMTPEQARKLQRMGFDVDEDDVTCA
jgi:hypothetical protein